MTLHNSITYYKNIILQVIIVTCEPMRYEVGSLNRRYEYRKKITR